MGILLGRDNELQAVHRLAQAALSEAKTTSTLVIGDPGVGKTALVEAAVTQFEATRTIRLTGYAAERTVPLAAARQLLQLVAEHEALRDLSEVLTDPAGVSERAYQAVIGAAPILLVVDDLQWIDPLTIGVAHYAIRGASAAGIPLATIVASRLSEQATEFVESLQRLLPDDQVEVLELAPLTRAAGIAVATAIAPGLPEEEAAELWERARGSPFWMRSLLEDGGASSTRDLALRRLRHCSEDGILLASMLALATRPLSRADAAEILEWPDERVERSAIELVDRGMTVSEGRLLHLVHDLLRDALTTSIDTPRRVELHRRLGSWLERLGADDPAALVEALAHVRAAGVDAGALALRIAASRGRRLLGEEAVGELLRVADDLSWASPDRVRLEQAIGRLAAEMGDQKVALARWSSVLEQASGAPDRAEAGLAAAKAATALGQPSVARQMLDSVAESAEPGSAPHVQRLALEALLLESVDHRLADARALSDEALVLARRLEAGATDAPDAARDAHLDALTISMGLAQMDDDRERMAALAEEAVDVSRERGGQQHLEAVLRLTTIRRRQDPAVTIERVRAVWREATDRVLPAVELEAAFWLATLLAQRGEVAEAESVIESARLLSMRAGRLTRRRDSIDAAARLIAVSRGPWQPALETLIDAARQAEDPHLRLRLWQLVAEWEARLKGSAAGTVVNTRVDAAIEAAKASKCTRCSTELHLRGAEALALIGDATRARVLLEEWDRTGDETDPFWALVRRRAAAFVVLTEEGAAAAHDALAAVLADSERMGLGLEALWDGIHLARAQAEVDRSAAAETLRRVAAKAHAGGAHTEEAVAERALRRLGVRTWVRQSAVPGDDALSGLTEREREIAQLIADGASNPDIAARLFLSRKTVERHVSNVLAKVGKRNRAQLAALVTQGSASSTDVSSARGS